MGKVYIGIEAHKEANSLALAFSCREAPVFHGEPQPYRGWDTKDPEGAVWKGSEGSVLASTFLKIFTAPCLPPREP